jgi:cell wall-associated NlpC family hydrolase
MADLAAKHQSDVVTFMKTSKVHAAASRAKADAALRSAVTKRDAVNERRAQAAAETKKFKTLLATLTKQQQAAYAARDAATRAQQASIKSVHAASSVAQSAQAGSSAAKSAHAGSSAAQRAVDFALAQLGKPYVFGAAGPGSYDCSGLTMAAWRAGGVALPHLASAQYNFGTHVSASELQPGDLVFFYNPIGHVAMYIGKGMLVSAPQTGENVKIVPFSYFTSDFVGATRLA